MKMKKDNKLLILGVVIVIILGILVYATRDKSNDKVDYSNMTEEEVKVAVEEKVNEMQVNELGQMGERDRMEYYVSSFIKAIENKDYEKAYDMLYDDFRTRYFSTFASFEEYAKTKFPSSIAMDYTNIERNGDVYVLWVTMSNPLGSKDSGIEMNFVVQEYDLNDFKLSFTVR